MILLVETGGIGSIQYSHSVHGRLGLMRLRIAFRFLVSRHAVSCVLSIAVVLFGQNASEPHNVWNMHMQLLPSGENATITASHHLPLRTFLYNSFKLILAPSIGQPHLHKRGRHCRWSRQSTPVKAASIHRFSPLAIDLYRKITHRRQL